MTSEYAPKPLKVLVVDDHSVVRHGIAQIVNMETDMQVCGEAENSGEALRKFHETKPDVMIVDLSLKNENGIDLIHRIMTLDETMCILVVTMFDELAYIQKSIQAGARGYFLKNENVNNIPGAIRKILKGDLYLSPDISMKLLHVCCHSEKDKTPVELLTQRELQILKLLGNGIRRSKIADKLFISVKTVSSHIENIKIKLGFGSTADVYRFAIQKNNTHEDSS